MTGTAQTMTARAKTFWAVVVSVVAVCAGVVTILAALNWGPFGQPAVAAGQSVAAPSSAAPADCPTRPDRDGGALSVVMDARDGVHRCRSSELSPVRPGSTLEYRIAYRNTSGRQQDDVVFRLDLPPGLRLVPNSIVIHNSRTPDGGPLPSNSLDEEGLNLGSYAPEGNVYLYFSVGVPGAAEMECGWSEFRSTAHVRPSGVEEESSSVTLRSERIC